MRAVLKYRLSVEQTHTTVMMRAGSIIRHVGVQLPRQIILWAEVPGSAKTDIEARTFAVVGTGQAEIKADWTYVGTAMDDPYVWHVYEVAG